MENDKKNKLNLTRLNRKSDDCLNFFKLLKFRVNRICQTLIIVLSNETRVSWRLFSCSRPWTLATETFTSSQWKSSQHMCDCWLFIIVFIPWKVGQKIKEIRNELNFEWRNKANCSAGRSTTARLRRGTQPKYLNLAPQLFTGRKKTVSRIWIFCIFEWWQHKVLNMFYCFIFIYIIRLNIHSFTGM